MAKLILVGQDQFTLVDDVDFDRFGQFRWSRCGWEGRYVGRGVKVDGKWTSVYLHREIAATDDAPEVDHANGDTFDNRRSNLRGVTRSQNEQAKVRLKTGNKSGIRGVYWWAARQTYRAGVTVNRKYIHLGYFPTLAAAEQAAIAGRRKYMTHAPECIEKAG